MNRFVPGGVLDNQLCFLKFITDLSTIVLYERQKIWLSLPNDVFNLVNGSDHFEGVVVLFTSTLIKFCPRL